MIGNTRFRLAMKLICNIQSSDGIHYWGREMTEDTESGRLYRDGPLWNLKPRVFECLKATGEIEPMDFAPAWYEGYIEESDLF